MCKLKYDNDFVVGTTDEDIYASYFDFSYQDIIRMAIENNEKLLTLKNINDDEKLSLYFGGIGVYQTKPLRSKLDDILFTRNTYFIIREKNIDYGKNLGEAIHENPEIVVGSAIVDIPSDRWMNDSHLPIDHKSIIIRGIFIDRDIPDRASVYKSFIKAIVDDLYTKYKNIPIFAITSPSELKIFKNIGFEKSFVDNLLMYMPYNNGVKLSIIERGLCYKERKKPSSSMRPQLYN